MPVPEVATLQFIAGNVYAFDWVHQTVHTRAMVMYLRRSVVDEDPPQTPVHYFGRGFNSDEDAFHWAYVVNSHVVRLDSETLTVLMVYLPSKICPCNYKMTGWNDTIVYKMTKVLFKSVNNQLFLKKILIQLGYFRLLIFAFTFLRTIFNFT